MSDQTGIEWTDATWNPIRGCSRVSEGCRHCYAERVAARFSGPGQPYEGLTRDGTWNGQIHFASDHLYDPLRWSGPKHIFVNSMSDLFHENCPDDIVAQVFGVMAWAWWKHKHVFQVLTKRPERMRALLTSDEFRDEVDGMTNMLMDDEDCPVSRWFDVFDRRPDDARGMTSPEISESAWWPLPNLWLGVSVEDQATADARIPELLKTPAAVRFVSYEPALGPVDWHKWMWPLHWHWDGKYKSPEEAIAAGAYAERKPQALVSAHAVFLDWLICGGESGPGARPMHPDWAGSARDQCVAAGVKFFFKQWGEYFAPEDTENYREGRWVNATEKCGHYCDPNEDGGGHDDHGQAWMVRVGKKRAGRVLDGRTWDEMPGHVAG